MPKSKRSKNTKKKRNPRVMISKNSSSQSHSNKSSAESPPQKRSSISSHSETSPFKGFNEIFSQNDKEPQIFESLCSNEENSLQANKSAEKERNDVFDKLLGDDYRSNFNRNIKTYTNRKKQEYFHENKLLDFQDCQNRDDIIRWLNDTRNVFDRCTQTQYEVDHNFDSQVMDIPSISQRSPDKVNKTTRETRWVRRSPYKLRARSLDIQIKKNGLEGRNKRHSLAGDTPDMENYHIEEDVTDEDVPVPANENVIQMIDLMEDEYLDNVEKEIMQHEEKKNQNVSGWDRIKDINKTLNGKQPKKLKIAIQESPNKKEPDLVNNNHPTYDYNMLEHYFVENMEKLLNKDAEYCGDSSSCKSNSSVEKGLRIGESFLKILHKLVEKEGRKCLAEFRHLVSDLKEFFNVPLEDNSTQTSLVQVSDANFQTEFNNLNVSVQTDLKLNDAEVQTVLNTADKIIQTKEDKVSVEIQTEDLDLVNENYVERAPSNTSSTASDFIFFNKDEKRKGENFSQEKDNKPEDPFDDDFVFEFNTEDILKGSENVVRKKSEDSVIMLSGESEKNGNKGIKRLLSESPVDDSEEKHSKRPCAQFINQDLSVEFHSCAEEQKKNEDEKKETVEFSDEDDLIFQECANKILENLENEQKSSEEVPRKSKTQQQIEELEEIIYDVTKPKPIQAKTSTSENTSNTEDDVDYFKLSSYTPNLQKPAQKSRKSLFDSKTADVKKSPEPFSESMFLNEENSTVVNNRTITQANVDTIMKEVVKDVDVGDDEADEEVKGIFESRVKKINILENVVVRPKDQVDNEDILSISSDEDFVESTPQKKMFPSFVTNREESALDITLPPPLEFQDTEKIKRENEIPKHQEEKILETSPPRRPLAAVNKITSTPYTQKPDSETMSLSPITFCGNNRKKFASNSFQDNRLSKITSPPNSENKQHPEDENNSNRKKRRLAGPYESAQKQFSKFCPLTIVRKPQENSVPSTPKQKSILNYVRSSQESQQTQQSQKSESFECGKRKPCIACSRVSKDQIIAISSLTNKKLATYSTSFTPKVTHLIVSANEKNCLKDHTIKFVLAVAAGIWVLDFKWIQDCLLKNALVPEESYEVLDVSGVPGPKKSRLTRVSNPLFKGYKIHAAAPFSSTTQQEIESVIRLLGGKVVPSPEDLLDKGGYVCVIVTEARATQDFELFETWLEALRVVTVDIEWLSRSVGQYQLLSLRPFTLCSDDELEKLGYPPELTANMTYSFSQQTMSSVPSST